MRRLLPLAVLWATAPSVPLASLAAQQSQPRSRDYLFSSSVDDARALWVNPAGLGWVTEASVMAEVVVDRAPGSLRLGQYTLGLNSRGLALAYERDRSLDSVSVGTLRLGLGMPVGRGSVGLAVSTYRRTRDEGLDLGFRYPLFPGLALGLVLREVGRPRIIQTPEPVSGTLGATWTVARRVAQLSGEATVAERRPASGYDWRYRAGVVLRAHRPWPLSLHCAADVNSDGTVRRWSLGMVIGGLDRVGVVVGATPTAGLGQPERFSALGIASRRPPGAVQ